MSEPGQSNSYRQVRDFSVSSFTIAD